MASRYADWLVGFGVVLTLLLIGGLAADAPVCAGFTPTPTSTETPTPTSTPTVTPTPVSPPPPPPPPPPPQPVMETPTPTPVAPLLPEVGGGPVLPAWPLLALGFLALMVGWLGIRRKA